MRSKLILSLVAATVLLSGSAMVAQTSDSGNSGQTQGQHQGRRMGGPGGPGGFDRMAEHLGLSEQQKSQIQPIFQAERQQMEALRNDTSLTQDQKRERFQQIREQTSTQVNGILTPEQQQKMKDMRSHMRRHRGPGGPGGPGGQDTPPPTQ